MGREKNFLPHFSPLFLKEFSIERPGRKDNSSLLLLRAPTLEMVFVAYPYCLSKLLPAEFPIVFLVAFIWFCNLFEVGVGSFSVFGGVKWCVLKENAYHMPT